MIDEFDRSKFLQDLDLAKETIEKANALGEEIGKRDYRRLILVGCGAPNAAMSILEYWMQKYSTEIDIRRYYPATLLNQNPSAFDQNTLVILGSHSGTTIETVNVAKWLRSKSCATIAITQEPQSMLAINVDHVLHYGQSKQGYYATFMILMSFFNGFLQENGTWEFDGILNTSLMEFPTSLAETIEREDKSVAMIAERFRDVPMLYLIGAGPTFFTAYVISTCVLMEMLRIHAHPLNAAEFFHGPFELIDKESSMILLLGEDPSRPEAERVANFCKKYASQFIPYDSKEFPMHGIHPKIRPILAPLFLDAALFRFAEHLSNLKDHPLTLRRYMGKVEY
jgi:fructoselysine 6-phosphate deglycase